ncbi:hypothetical protein [Symbioplanes lichenis]|uniref:hypothetical protein n=1 Tax=Symbioplanes lichenis TaxID=1629072 RepID=UPI00273817C5|nr:hypothetical protein [Actinoplanes lichenis]
MGHESLDQRLGQHRRFGLSPFAERGRGGDESGAPLGDGTAGDEQRDGRRVRTHDQRQRRGLARAGLDPVQAATLPMVVQTAAWTLEILDPRPGSTLLIHGAGGMAGYACVQVALRRGIQVIATAGPTFAADLEKLGARVTIDELRPDVTPATELLPRYAALAAQGEFHLPIAKTYPLDDWRSAVELSLTGNPHGKLVLLPGDGPGPRGN